MTSSQGIEEHLLRFERLKDMTGGNGGGNEPPRTTPAGNPGYNSPSESDDERPERPLIPRRRRWAPPKDSEASKKQEMEDMAEFIAIAVTRLNKASDPGKRLPIKAPETFDGTFTKFRRWWESIDEYFTIHATRVPDDQTKIYSLGTFLRDQAADWYTERKRTMKTLHLNDNWLAFSTAMEERFTDRQETGKDHEKLLSLEYAGDMQTYLARFNELNSRVQLSGQALKRVITAAVTPDMYRYIWRKYGKIPDTDADLRHAVRAAGIEEEELARALSAKKQITCPQKEKEKVADQKGNTSQKAEKPREKIAAPTKVIGGMGPDKWDKFPGQKLLWGGFKEATKEVPEEELEEYRKKDADCRRCG